MSSQPAPALAISGPAGIGRTALLGAAMREFAARRVRAVSVTCQASGKATDYALLYRIVSAIGSHESHTVLDLIAKASTAASGTAEPMAAHLNAMVAAGGPAVLLLDDAQFADEASMRVLRGLDPAACRLVLTYENGATLGDLPCERIALPALTRDEVAQVLREQLAAEPEDRVVDRVHRMSAGIPLAVLATVEGYLRSGRLRVIDGHSFLTRSHERPLLPVGHRILPEGHRVLRQVRRAGETAGTAARALAVLSVFGPAAEDLLAETGLIPAPELPSALSALVDHGVLERVVGGWRFPVPVVAELLGGLLTPIECELVHGVAARAMIEGRVQGPDEEFLPDCVAASGGSPLPEDAGKMLLHAAERILGYDNERAARWAGIAQHLLEEPVSQQARVLRTRALLASARSAEAAKSALALLSEATCSTLWELVDVYARALSASRDRVAVEEFVDHGWTLLPAPPAWRHVCRGLAMIRLEHRAIEMRDHMMATEPIWSEDPIAAPTGYATLASTMLSVGDPAAFVGLTKLHAPSMKPGAKLAYLHTGLQRAAGLLLFGEFDQALDALTSTGLTAGDLEPSVRVVHDFLRGDWDSALSTARRTEAAWADGQPPFATTHIRMVPARVLAARGRFGQAKAWIELDQGSLIDSGARAIAMASVEMTLGDHPAAVAILREAWTRTVADGKGVLLDEILGMLVQAECVTRDFDSAARTLAELRRVATAMGTGRAELFLLLGRMRVHSDSASAEAAVALARRRGQPYETARACTLAAAFLTEPGEALGLAYDLFGELDAAPWRATVRERMRDTGVPVPGRSTAAEETDELLCHLVADGFGNKRIADVLCTSAKGVEGRITRLLGRTGLRSRVELATAVLRGATPWTPA